MQFTTPVIIPNYKENISYSNKIMFLGSCFSDNIGTKFKEHFFDAEINPFGVIYNPYSVKKSIEILLDKILFKSDMLFEHNGLWHSFAHHSSFTGKDVEKTLKKINDKINYASDFLKQTDFLFLTFGTAWIYELANNGEIVSNCHKLPTSNFNRRLLKVDQIYKEYEDIIIRLKESNPNLKIFFTISPVRHLKDGANGNQISKSTLLLAVNELVNNHEHVYYFPSYEIIMDELRDYRFYESDMIHISKLAVDYIWEKITDSLFDNKTKEAAKLAGKLFKSLNHRVFDKDSEEYTKFKNSIKKQINILKQLNDSVNLSAAETQIENL